MNPAQSDKTLLFGSDNSKQLNNNQNSSGNSGLNQDDILAQAAQLANSLNQDFEKETIQENNPLRTNQSINQVESLGSESQLNLNQKLTQSNLSSPINNNKLNSEPEIMQEENSSKLNSENSEFSYLNKDFQKNNNLNNNDDASNLNGSEIGEKKEQARNFPQPPIKKFHFGFKKKEEEIKNPKEANIVKEVSDNQDEVKIEESKLPNITITNLKAREILDSRGVPTVEVTLKLSNGSSTISSISTSVHNNNFEATQIRDHDENRMLGMGVLNAVKNVNEVIAPNIIGLNPFDQEKIDLRLLELDGTKNASKLGSNATMTVSQAVLKAGSIVLNLPTYYYVFKKYNLCSQITIPTCLYGLIDGGKHGSKNNIDFQEFQIVPANHIPFNQSLEMAVSVFNNLKRILIEKGAACSVGPSGGYTPNLFKNTDAFELLIEAIKDSGYNVGRDVFFGIDADGTFLEEKGKYKLRDFNTPVDTKTMIDYYKKLNSVYGLYVIEDPFSKIDEKSWIEINKEMGEITRIVGDNNLAANKLKLQKAIKKNACNTVLVKTGQLSTITEMFEIIQIAKNNNWQVIISNREGETNDDLIADIAVGIGANFLKFGPPNRGERIAKYNRLLKINQELERLNHV